MERAIFDKYQSLIFQTSGIFLSEGKVSLLTARIGKRIRTLGLPNYESYYDHVVGDGSGVELGELLNAISTNVTHFFREPQHFRFLAARVKEMSAAGTQPIRIWCAAASSGEEPYSIAFTVLDHLAQAVPVEIIASDISTKVLQIAEYGVYRQQDVKDIPAATMRRYFQEGTGRAASYFRVKPEVRKLVTFKQINLSTPPFPVTGPFDFIFCRNVMIYFNEQLRAKLLRHFSLLLKPQGNLFLGLAESVAGRNEFFSVVEPAVYHKST